ncbi:CPSF A subunit region protein, partial [Cardiosporidium cionae]
TEYIAVGVGRAFGEHVECEGKLYLLGIPSFIDSNDLGSKPAIESASSVSPAGVDNGNIPLLPLLMEKSFSGPVTVVLPFSQEKTSAAASYSRKNPTKDMILHSAGELRGGGDAFVRGAFADASTCVTSATIMKEYLIIGDFHKGIHFLVWRYDPEAESRSLHLLSRSYPKSIIPTIATEALAIESTLGLVCADAFENLRLFSYNSIDHSSEVEKLEILQTDAEFHVGSRVCRLLHFPTEAHTIAVLGVTNEGALFVLHPILKTDFNILKSLQDRIVDSLPFNFGVNPLNTREGAGTASLSSSLSQKDKILDASILRYLHFLSSPLLEYLLGRTGPLENQELILSRLNQFDLSAAVAFKGLYTRLEP